MGKQRVEYIDIAKGLGILLVVWGHSSKFLFNEIYAFHMPLFFFIAGFFFKGNVRCKEFITKKIKSLIIPYFIFYSFTLLFYYSLLTLTGRSDLMDCGVLLDYIPLDNDILNTPLWFLYALFWMSVFYYFLRKYIKNEWIILGIGILSYGLNELLKVNEVNLPMFINRSLGELIYMHLGFIFYNILQAEKLVEHSSLSKITQFCLSICIFVFMYSINTVSEYGKYILTPLVALSGTMTIIYLSAIIQKNEILTYFGKHSLVIFSLHLPLFELSRPIAKRVFATDGLEYDITVFASSLFFAIVLGEVFMLAFPKYLGESKLRSFLTKL